MSEIAVIIPNYKGKNVIRDCLNSLREQDFKGFDIIVADNKSDDGSLDIIEKEYPEVKLIKLSDNFGFSRAVNEGLKVSSHPYVILLNNDTRVDKSFVRSLYEAIKSDNRIFSVSAKMLQMDRPDRIDGAGDYYIRLVTPSDTVLKSFKVTIVEPLNFWAIVIIVVVVLAVLTVTIVIIVLRHKMRIR